MICVDEDPRSDASLRAETGQPTWHPSPAVLHLVGPPKLVPEQYMKVSLTMEKFVETSGVGVCVMANRYDLVALSKKRPPPVAIWLETSHVDRVS